MDDKPFKVVEYSTDITGQVRQSALHAAFKGALDNLSSNVMVVDTDLNIIYEMTQQNAVEPTRRQRGEESRGARREPGRAGRRARIGTRSARVTRL
jgi:hypothetical protein